MMKLLQWLIAQEWLMRALSPLIGAYNPFLPEYRRDPHVTWKKLRENSPVFYSRGFGAWMVTRHEDVSTLLRDPAVTADRSETAIMRFTKWANRNEPEFRDFMQQSLLVREGAEHRRLRGLVSKAFTPRRVAELRPRLESLAETILDDAAARGKMELVEEFAYPFPVVAIAEMLGIPAEDRRQFHGWTSDLVQLLDPFQGKEGAEPMRRATRELYAYFRPLLAARRVEPRDDLMSAMIQAEDAGTQLDEGDLLALCTLLLAAGHETTANLIGNSVVALLRNPDQRKRLQEDPALFRTAIDEFLRYDSPIQWTDRALAADTQIAGQSMRRGQMVAIGLAAANRDPEVFDDPDRLDLSRDPNPHLAFGHGAHFCIGSQLARLEAEIALSALLTRFPDFSGPVDPPSWRRSMLLRGPASLPIELGNPA